MTMIRKNTQAIILEWSQSQKILKGLASEVVIGSKRGH